MKILVLDIETSPHIAKMWGAWQQDIHLPQLIQAGGILCWSAKWVGDKSTKFDSIRSGAKKMMQGIHELVCEADAIVTYNGIRFDIPHLNSQFAIHKMKPPSPSHQIDLIRTVKSRFKFFSNKLEYVCGVFGVGEKMKHHGFELWNECMRDDDKAWRTMEKYNRMDVTITEALYLHLLPWIKNHPNRNLHGDTNGCINCGADRLQRRGVSRTATGVFERYQCQACGKWQRGEKQRAASNLMREVP